MSRHVCATGHIQDHCVTLQRVGHCAAVVGFLLVLLAPNHKGMGELDFFQTWRESLGGPTCMPIYFLFSFKNGDMAAIFVF